MALKVIWCSRHELGADQLADLSALLGAELEVAAENVTWQATDNAAADIAANAETWKRLAANADVLAGVFPPVAVEAALARGGIANKAYSPVSRQSREMRADGTAQIKFEHVRWARVL